ncbi:hypothetical protein [Methylobacterium soli]|uniref:hypothetical protein n=1 Tax=Methylobacterium soli TaxID=553447 RepID=UPI0017866B85|nr:hypothetical protein [Methylobacterium soli]GJE41636.1 hypothetical protein AEGHOMDF_0802 [Methylobacterium soli]
MLASSRDKPTQNEDDAAPDLTAAVHERRRPWPTAADLLRMDHDERVAWERIIAEALC